MKKLVFILAMFTMLLTVNAQINSERSTIEVNGTAEMEIIPDKIEITISANDKDFKTKELFEEFEKKIVDNLKAMGISIKNEFAVMNMNSSLKVSVIGKDNMYSTRQYVVVVHNTQTANQVFKEMDRIGVNTIAITNFSHSQIDSFRLQVKINAIKAAKDKALALTNAIGQTIGKAVFINEERNDIYQPNVYANVMYKSKELSDYDEIEHVNFQKINLKYSVFVRFELK